MEHDASLVHDDYYFEEKVWKVNKTKVTQLVNLANGGVITMEELAKHKVEI